MPRYRDEYIEKGKTLDDSGTYTMEISPIDPVSEIMITLGAENGATHNKDAPVARIVSKIEVLDGADILFSMNGREAQALFFYMAGRMPLIDIVEEGGLSSYYDFPLRFGRWLWDPIYALVPTKFRNLQLKITWDLAAVRATGATGFVAGSLSMSVITRLIEGLETPPTGFMMSKKHYEYSSAASGEERISLPTDFPYAIAMISAREAGINLSTTLTNIRLNIDNGKYVPFDLEIGDFKDLETNNYGLTVFDILGKGDDAEVHQAWLGDLRNLVAMAQPAGTIATLATLDAGQYSLGFRAHDGTTPSNISTQIRVVGTHPWNTIGWPFGIFADPTTYLDAPKHGDIKLILTQGNAGATVSAILAQLRNYTAT